jgi:hypothetical protein
MNSTETAIWKHQVYLPRFSVSRCQDSVPSIFVFPCTVYTNGELVRMVKESVVLRAVSNVRGLETVSRCYAESGGDLCQVAVVEVT